MKQYPYGLPIGNLSRTYPLTTGGAFALEDKYQYNQKELNNDFGLLWNDYGARWYDPQLARWHQIDPLAEKYAAWSGYNYVGDNPVNAVDPDGRVVLGSDGQPLTLSQDDKGNYSINGQPLEQTSILFNAMLLTPSGTEAISNYINSDKEFKFSITEEVVTGENNEPVHASTTAKEKDGEFSYYDVVVSTANINDRLDVFSTEEKLNIIGTHEEAHINPDGSQNYNEKQAVEIELKDRFEYSKLYPEKSAPQNAWRSKYEGFLNDKKVKKIEADVDKSFKKEKE